MAQTKKLQTVEQLLEHDKVKQRFISALGEDKAQQFMLNLLQINKQSLKGCTAHSVINAAATAATMNLAIIPTIGESYIIPFNNRKAGTKNAMFMIGWKGYVQLALRTNLYNMINPFVVYENQFHSFDYSTEELIGDFTKRPEGRIIGYAAKIKCSNIFKKTMFWYNDEMQKHAREYSQAYGYDSSWWKKDPVGMGKKTMLRQIIDKYGPKSPHIRLAMASDYSVQEQEGNFVYMDNGMTITKTQTTFKEIDNQKERKRLLEAIENSTTLQELQRLRSYINTYDVVDEYMEKEAKFKNQ